MSTKKRIGVIGSGVVGQTLAGGFVKHGCETMVGSRDAAKLKDWTAKSGSLAKAGTVQEAARFGDIVVLAVKGIGAEDAVRLAGPETLAGKVVIDATNPIAEAPPTNGVLKFFTNLDESLMERLQRLAPKARFVKAFSCVGNALMVNPKLPGGPPTRVLANTAFAEVR